MRAGYSFKKGIGLGALGGACAGIAMLAVMGVTTVELGMSAKAFPVLIGIIMGQGYDTAAKFGFGIHMATSIAIGVVFGALICNERFQVTGYAKGVVIGIIFGLISFSVLYWPIVTSILVLPIMGLMHTVNPNMPEAVIVQRVQTAWPALTAGALAAHIVYGAVLGSIVSSVILLRNSHLCKICNVEFANEKEFLEHNEQYHAQMH